jgi:hypothetical protein
MIHARSWNQRHFNKNLLLFSRNDTVLIVHPKRRQHNEGRVNPLLLLHERDSVTPRYNQDLPCQKWMPTTYGAMADMRKKCRCAPCEMVQHWKRIDAQREAETSLNKLTIFGPPRSMVPGAAKARQGPYPDWDWGGWDKPYVHEDHDLELTYEDDKVAPEATLALLAMAKR